MSKDKPHAEVASRLRGAWRVARLTDSGKEAPREEDDDHFLWFTDEVIVTGDQWAAWDMPYTMWCDRTPMEIDITRDDLAESWVQKCIFEVKGDTLRICGAASAARPRPSRFSSTAANKQVLYVAERCAEPRPE
jgi:uncharacterized protein (TIGR03067 family)